MAPVGNFTIPVDKTQIVRKWAGRVHRGPRLPVRNAALAPFPPIIYNPYQVDGYTGKPIRTGDPAGAGSGMQELTGIDGAVGTDDAPRRPVDVRQASDRVYRGLGTAAGLVTLTILVLIGWFLLPEGGAALRQNGFDFVTGTEWTQAGPFGIAAVMYWTVVTAVIALVLALP